MLCVPFYTMLCTYLIKTLYAINYNNNNNNNNNNAYNMQTFHWGQHLLTSEITQMSDIICLSEHAMYEQKHYRLREVLTGFKELRCTFK